MKRIIMFVLLFAALKVAGQTTGYLRFDTVKIMRQNGTCELYVINKTKDSLGLLTNVGGGLTQFRKSRMLNDSTIIIGLDTLVIPGSGGTPGITELTGPITAGPGSGSQATSITNNSIEKSKLEQSPGLSVIGNIGNTTDDVGNIVAANDGNVLRRFGTSIGFGTINLASTNAVGSSILPVLNGGTGTMTPSLVQGTNITITGTWPNQTINSTGGGSTLTSTQIAYGDGSNVMTSEAAFNYNATNNRLAADSIKTKIVSINPNLATNDVIDIGNTDSDSGVDSTGRHGWTQSETTSVGWPRKNIVLAWGYNDPQSASKYNPVAGSYYQHFESDFFGQFEWIMGSITHGGYTQRHMFSHTNKYTGSADLSMAYSEGVKIYGFDSTSYPYFAVAEGNAVFSGIDQTLKIENKNLHNGHVFSSFTIAPQSDGSVNMGTGTNTNVVSMGNQLSINSGNQYAVTNTLSNSNNGFVSIGGSTTANGGYPYVINSEVSASGGTIFLNKNTHSTGAAANILESGSNGDVMTLYRSAGNSNDITTGYSYSNNDFRFTSGAGVLLGGTNLMTIKPTQKIGIGGVTSPTARLHITAGTATANTAPLKIDAGTNLTTPEAGAVEFDGSEFYGTVSSNRHAFARVLKGTTNWTPGVVAAGSSTSTTITVTGAVVGDPVTVSKKAGYSNGEVYDAFVSATNTVTIRVHNVSTGSANYNTAEDYNVVVLKY